MALGIELQRFEATRRAQLSLSNLTLRFSITIFGFCTHFIKVQMTFLTIVHSTVNEALPHGTPSSALD